MKHDIGTDHFQRWPYIAESRPDGDHNNGAIDLVAEPHRLAEIHEATEENGLKDFLESMNKPDRPFMTLGCAAGYLNSTYCTYVEFTPRNQKLAQDIKVIHDVHRQWLRWSIENCAAHPGLADALRQSVEWAYREFSFRGSDPQYLITIYPRTRSARDHGLMISWVHNFLCTLDLENLGADHLK
ncbi:hypothetical protein AUC61_14650 [Pseudomonas sp. S25]|uniref:Uncharacterized protein n=1 Tax=Pseudomonas maioricensis TaxID=1766623 RepID=A0ABS9ZJL6_9PSED|nr:hypothetical protein [Pseudomonas sp. S25]MCI8210775.1 hypothetical protein [Pseudomonas sp. S25]